MGQLSSGSQDQRLDLKCLFGTAFWCQRALGRHTAPTAAAAALAAPINIMTFLIVSFTAASLAITSPLLRMPPPPPAAPSVCTGYGARLEARTASVTTYAEKRAVYTSFTDTVLRGFKGGRLLNNDIRIKGSFEAEAERWVDKAWTSSQFSVTEVITGNISAAQQHRQNSSSVSSRNSTQPTVVGAALSCLTRLYHGVMATFDARPPSFISLPPPSRTRGANGLIVLLSGGDRNAALAERVVANHGAFARRHGYAHWWHRGSLVADLGWRAYWHKVAHLRLAFSRFPDASAYAWVDDDIIFTNHLESEDMLARALSKSNASVIVTTDPSGSVALLNTGIILVRNDEEGKDVLSEMWRRATAVREDGLSLAHDAQSAGCLHEQQALQEMLRDDSNYWRSKVAVLQQRTAAEEESQQLSQYSEPAWNLNTFLRWSHFHAERKEEMRYDGDASSSRWSRGDFVGHCSGLSPVRRALCVAALLGAVVS